MFGHYALVYSFTFHGYKNTGSSQATIDIAKALLHFMWHHLFIVLGNFMTKAKRNAVVGLRTVSLEYA